MIAILGSGISGLFAAWACLLNGKDFLIYTKDGDKPYVMPCTYLHQDCGIPFLTMSSLKQYCVPKRLNGFDISHDPVKLGRMYSKKVYGREDAENNFAEKGLRSSHPVWNMQQAVDFLWNATRNCVEYGDFKNIEDIKKMTEDSELVVSTLPLDQFHIPLLGTSCRTRWITEFKSESNEDYCIFNVSGNTNWYRMGNVFGRSFIESLDQLQADSYQVKKLDSIDNPPVVDKVLFTGRYGAWSQKLLAHDVFYEVLKKI